MAAFTHTDLIDWSKQLPDWQRDALRRVLQGEVTDRDIEELAELAAAPHSPSPAQKPEPVPAVDDPGRTEVSHDPPAVRILAIREIARVNALANGPVQFAVDGFTVIYGGNASGKTGIARILKKACRSREPGGPIRPNVFQPQTAQPASATIDFIVGDERRSHAWAEGHPGEAALRTVNVFDSRCAAVQVERPNQISFTPAVLQVLRNLAATVDRVADKLRRDKVALGARQAALDQLGLDPATTAGRFMQSLGPDSDPHALQVLSTLNDAEAGRLRELDRALTDDPVRRAEAEEARDRGIGELERLTTEALGHLSDEACDRLTSLMAEGKKAQAAAEAAREAFAASSTLGGIGTEAWRALWESAKRYSETHAYAGEAFPVVREGAVCVLCQQPLDRDTSRRLHSFEEFVKADVQQRADRARDDVAKVVTALRSVALPASMRSAIKDAGLAGNAIGSALRRHLVGLKQRRRHLLRLAAAGAVGRLPPLPAVPDLEPARKGLRDEAARLRLASQAEQRLILVRERDELRAREKLAMHAEAIRHEVDRLRSARVLDAAIGDCRTHAITHKARQAAELIVTNQLRDSFASNLSAVGFAETAVEVRIGAGEHGEHPYELKLLARPDVPPVEVLSEGERTCVAVAGFLAELETTGNRSGIIFDDPVSSLDHHYRKRLAERLVREARQRQVVVFTHDVVFLYLLRKYSRELGIALAEVSLERGYKANHGRAIAGPPWVAMSVNQRITKLRNDLVEARRVLNAGDRPEYERRAVGIYMGLRQSWERAVEEVLLHQVVVRFGDSVQTQRLSKIVDVQDDDVATVTREMSRCSDFVHDESGAVHADAPGPDVVEADIVRLDEWVTNLRRNRGRS